MEDNIFTLNEGTGPHPLCDKRDILLPWEGLATGKLVPKICNMVAERKYLHFVTAAAWEASGNYFRVWHHVLERVEIFKYLVQILSYDNSYWPDVDG